MKKFIIKVLCAFVPSKNLRKKIRLKFLNNNIVDAVAKEKTKGFNISYAQFGEDIVVEAVFAFLFNKTSENISYLEIGSNNPTESNNTYYFYKKNGRGVLIELNHNFAKITKKSRPNDIFLNCGMAFDKKRKSTYYDFGKEAHALNTFSKERADEVSKSYKLVNKISLPLVDINEIFLKYFKENGADYVSVDVEGLDLDILKTIDFKRFRPKIFCVEANKKSLAYCADNEIVKFMNKNEYALVADTFINFIFADTKQMNPVNKDLKI